MTVSDVQYFDPTTGVWETLVQSQPGGGATNLDGLTDVDTTTVAPNDGEFLGFNGVMWIPKSIPASSPPTGEGGAGVYLEGVAIPNAWQRICSVTPLQYSYGSFWLNFTNGLGNVSDMVRVEWWCGNTVEYDGGPLGSFLHTNPISTHEHGDGSDPALSRIRMVMDSMTNAVAIEMYATDARTWYLEYDPSNQDITVLYEAGPVLAEYPQIVAEHEVNDNMERISRNGTQESVMARTLVEVAQNWTIADDATDQLILVSGPSYVTLPDASHNLVTIKNIGADTVTILIESWMYLEGVQGGTLPLLPGEASSFFLGAGYKWWRMAGTTGAGGLSAQAEVASLKEELSVLRDRLTALENPPPKTRRRKPPQGGHDG